MSRSVEEEGKGTAMGGGGGGGGGCSDLCGCCNGGESGGDTDVDEGKDEAIGSKRLCVCEKEREKQVEAFKRERERGEGPLRKGGKRRV